MRLWEPVYDVGTCTNQRDASDSLQLPHSTYRCIQQGQVCMVKVQVLEIHEGGNRGAFLLGLNPEPWAHGLESSKKRGSQCITNEQHDALRLMPYLHSNLPFWPSTEGVEPITSFEINPPAWAYPWTREICQLPCLGIIVPLSRLGSSLHHCKSMKQWW